MIALFDGLSVAIVAGGTLAATLAHCGPRACRTAMAKFAELPRGRFNLSHAKAELARQISEIAQDGLVRSEPVPIGDAEIDESTSALIRARSLDALTRQHAVHRQRRLERAQTASGVVYRAGELAPVLGMAGTLISLASLANGSTAATGGLASAIGMAVLTTLYGLILANFVFSPLGNLLDRRAKAEDDAREELFAWLETKIRQADPHAVQRRQEKYA